MYWYLATPYSKFLRGKDEAFNAAVRINADLINAGYHVYSPIVHCHPMHKAGLVHEGDYQFWAEFNETMIRACKGLLVCKLDGWQNSEGVLAEIELCAKIPKPIRFMFPEAIPVL